MRTDCSPDPARLSATAGIWGENVIWSDCSVVLHYSVVNVDGEWLSLNMSFHSKSGKVEQKIP